MGKYGYKITFSEEAYRNLRTVKERLGTRTWDELSRKLLELLIVRSSRAEQSTPNGGKA